MTRIGVFALALLMLFAGLGGCADKQADGYTKDNVQSNIVSISYPESIVSIDRDRQQEVIEKNAVDTSILNSIRKFSYESGSVILGSETKNVCYSPLSLYMVLAMLSTGANGETQDEILDLLNETDTKYLSEQMGKLFRLMYRDNERSTFFMANSLWINSDYRVKQEFVDNAMEHFYAAANTLDFKDPSAGDTISRWIRDNTKELLEPEIKTEGLEILYIVNTVYLKDAWVYTFDEEATKADKFILADGSVVETEFMHNSYDCDVAYRNGFTALDLRLVGTGKMTFVLPDEGVEISSLLSNPEIMASMTDRQNTEYVSVNLSLPKFDFESDFDLKDHLINLGMVKAFNEQQADLYGITETTSFVSKTNQGTTITVNEDGLEAAAYTYVATRDTSCPSKTIDLSFNRPFIFIVQSNEGVPVFIGVVQNPNE